MKNNFKLTAIIFSFFLCVSCGEKIYEVSMSKELFDLAKQNGVFDEKESLKKYPEGLSFEVYSHKKVHIEILSSELDSIEKPFYKKAIKAGTITTVTKNTPIEQDYENKKGIEISRCPLFPCEPFSENSEKYIKIENIDPQYLFTASQIPQNYIAKGVQTETKNIYANDPDYPFFKIDFADFNFEQLESIENKTKWDISALEYLQNNLLNEVFLEKLYKTPENTNVTFICAVGDMMLGRGVQDSMFNTKKAETVFTDTLPILQNNSFTIGNLECVVTTRDLKTKKTYNFKVSKDSLTYLKEAGFDYLMMTNNHSYDYGEEGFKDTLKAVKEAGFATSGVGYNETEALDFYRTNINEQNYSILSVAAYPIENSGFNGEKQATATDKRAGVLWKSDKVIDLVKKEKETGAVIIINVHAGSEYVTKPNEVQKTFYKELCDAGADVIFGSHPHVLQPIEMYNGSLIVWSLGNFVFPGMDEMYGATDTMIVRTGFVENKLVYYEKYPATIKNTKVVLK